MSRESSLPLTAGAYGLERYRALQNPTVPDHELARVVCVHRNSYTLATDKGGLPGKLSGQFSYSVSASETMPVSGDWVRIRHAGESVLILDVLPRFSSVRRQHPHLPGTMQVLAANLDVLFVLCTFEGARGINLNRIDRYLSLFDSPKIQPVILVNKADLSPEPSAIYELFKRSGYACQVHAVSATQGIGMGELRKYFLGGKTGALVGPSGVGKTTILNVLTEAGGQKTAEVRSSDKRGRHTTSSRQLFVLAGGGILLDTPGLREVGVPANLDDGLLPFKTIEQYAHGCKFTNCRHHSEPGCAVLAAVRAQEITQEQYEHYLVLRAEKERHDGWHDEHVRRLRDEQWKKISAWSKRNKDPFGRKNNPWT